MFQSTGKTVCADFVLVNDFSNQRVFISCYLIIDIGKKVIVEAFRIYAPVLGIIICTNKVKDYSLLVLHILLKIKIKSRSPVLGRIVIDHRNHVSVIRHIAYRTFSLGIWLMVCIISYGSAEHALPVLITVRSVQVLPYRL